MKRILLLSLLCIFGWQAFSQTLTELDKKLPHEVWSMTYRNRQGRAIDMDGDYAVISSEGYNHKHELVYVVKYNGTQWEKLATLQASDNATDDHFGFEVSIQGDCIVVGAHGDDDGVSGSGSVYVYTKPATGWHDMTETAKLSASDAAQDDYFGSQIDVYGDIIVVGSAKQEKAYIFSKPESGWENMTETATLTPSDGQASDRFGSSVSIYGDYIVVGSPYNDNSSNNGAAYVFKKPATGWEDSNEIAKLTASTSTMYGSLGDAVSIYEDKIVAGDVGERIAYVFVKPSGEWIDATQTAKLTPSESLNYKTFFGREVSISGKTVIVGAPSNYLPGRAYYFIEPETGWTNMSKSCINDINEEEDYDYYAWSVAASDTTMMVGAYGKTIAEGNFDTGVTYVHKYDKSSNTLSKEELLVPTIDSVSQYFGLHVDIDGDYAVVSTNTYSNNTGYAYVFHKTGDSWEKVARLTPSSRKKQSSFGKSVSIEGDVIVIGCPDYYENNEAWHEGSGVAFVYVKPETGWEDMTQTAILRASNHMYIRFFGCSVDISGDDIFVGSRDTGDNGDFSGAVYVYTKPEEGWHTMYQTAKLLPSDGNTGAEFGNVIAVSGDDLIVGTPYSDPDGNSSGSAYIFTKPEGGWVSMTETAKLKPTNPRAGRYFGRSVSISEDAAVIGSYYYDADDEKKLTAYVFEKPEEGWGNMTETAQLLPSDLSHKSFGDEVDIHGDLIAVCSNTDDDIGELSGSVHVYVRPEGGWTDTTESVKLLASDAMPGDRLGASVAVSGNNFVVGSAHNDELAANAGAAYFFQKNDIAVNTQPENQKVSTGTAAEFAVDADYVDTYKWQRSYDNGESFLDIIDDNVYSGSQTSNFSVVVSEGNSSDQYRCILTSPWGKVITDTVKALINHAPTGISISAVLVNENETVGTIVAELTTEDEDAGESFTYTLIAGDGTNDANNSSFTIEGANLLTAEEFDFEAQEEYNIYVQTEDASGATYSEEFTISVENVNEAPTNISISNLEIDENNSVGSVIGQLSTEDVDAGDTYTYTLIAGDGTNDADNASFTIDGESLKAAMEFDFETQTEYSINIQSEDAGGLTYSKSFVISINDLTETGIKTFEEEGISIYPNPTNGIMEVQFTDDKFYSVKVFNLLGEVIFEKQNISKSETINISDRINGIYIVTIESGNKIISRKIMKR
ncbi:MAG: T9SS type A sorting domain-containing protein [Bacteroidetes bacterium]|nr:T9SS type A sorting domain-containing protein [Bacteroidota bacterium]